MPHAAGPLSHVSLLAHANCVATRTLTICLEGLLWAVSAWGQLCDVVCYGVCAGVFVVACRSCAHMHPHNMLGGYAVGGVCLLHGHVTVPMHEQMQIVCPHAPSALNLLGEYTVGGVCMVTPVL